MSETIELIQPVEVVRDADGGWSHPQLPDFGEAEHIPVEEWQAWLNDQQLECVCVEFEYDAPEELTDAWADDGCAPMAKWEPTKPEGDGWFMLGIWDTEDGPVCYWLRRIAQEQAA